MKKINFRYAFGEILIVIIGITIAFMINKSADNSKTKKLRNQYLVNLKKDVEADKKQLKDNIAQIELKIKTTGEILASFNSKSNTNLKVFQIASIINFSPNNITYQTLINSGDLSLIDNFQLRTDIEKHYASYKLLAKAYQRQENIHKDYLGKYFVEHVDYDLIQQGKNGFTKTKLLKNIIQSINGSLLIKKQATKKAAQSCDSLLVVLEKAI